MATRSCAAEKCRKQFTGHASRKYCSDTCRDREKKRRWREKQRQDLIDPRKIKRGDAYQTLVDNPRIAELLDQGELTQRDVARAVGVAASTFSEDYTTFLMDGQLAESAADWSMDEQLAQWLATGEYDYDPDTETLNEFLDRAIEGFVRWRNEFFKTPRGPYYTKAFHRVWIRGVLRSIYTGSRQAILSPPRHGKSELLVHFAIWLISRNPDFRIIWIGPNLDIASDMVGLCKRILEENHELRERTLPPGATWQPTGRNKTSWGTTKLTVANRTMALKAPTLRAVGRGQKILSMDVDLIICDDIDDFDSTINEKSRSDTRHWMFNNVESRKEEHTAWLVIGSRQHPDDIYAYLIDDEEWDVVVDSAHSRLCTKDELDVDVHVDCMLFPEIRSYRWLLSKLRTARNQGLEANFEMVYLNDPRPTGMVVFSQSRIDASKNHRRGLGVEGMKTYVADELGVDRFNVGYHLVAGLDPSATGYQAGFLWAWVRELNRLFAIDISNEKGGGIYKALDLFVEWHELYGVKHWVWENNIMSEDDLLQNSDVRAFTDANNIYLEPLNTQGGNRNNPTIGVGAMAGMWESEPPMIDLPWGTEAARDKFVVYERQLVKFVETADTMRRVNRKTDILMASWFPMKAIRRFRKEHQAQADVSDDFSFTNFGTTEWDTAPW